MGGNLAGDKSAFEDDVQEVGGDKRRKIRRKAPEVDPEVGGLFDTVGDEGLRVGIERFEGGEGLVFTGSNGGVQEITVLHHHVGGRGVELADLCQEMKALVAGGVEWGRPMEVGVMDEPDRVTVRVETDDK